MSWRSALDRFTGRLRPVPTAVDAASLPDEGTLPDFAAATGWLNSPPLTWPDLAGRVVLVDFWTYSCINCLRTLPHLKHWHELYGPAGLTIIGIHTPEFDFEKDPANVEAAVRRLRVPYAVALDADYRLWNAYRNRYWPAHYFVDGRGHLRYRHFGEGRYEHSEEVIRSLLAESGRTVPPLAPAATELAAANFSRIKTPETYFGWQRLEYLGSPESVRLRTVQKYSATPAPSLNIFYLLGEWRIDDDFAETASATAGVIYRYDASAANLVLAGPAGTTAMVELDGQPVNAAEAGSDITWRADGQSIITLDAPRLYSLVDARGRYAPRLLKLTFLSPGVRAYAFTFG